MIGHQVRQARQRKGLTTPEAAKLAKVSRKLLWKVEHDQPVTLDAFRRVITALEMRTVALGDVTLLPLDIDRDTIRAAAMAAIEHLQALVTMLDAAVRPLPAEDDTSIDTDAALAAAAGGSPHEPLTDDDPVIVQLQKIVDDLASRRGGSPKR